MTNPQPPADGEVEAQLVKDLIGYERNFGELYMTSGARSLMKQAVDMITRLRTERDAAREDAKLWERTFTHTDSRCDDWEKRAQTAEAALAEMTKERDQHRRLAFEHFTTTTQRTHALSRSTAECERLRGIVAKCEAKFWFYAVQHRSKTPPDETKARVNQEMSELCQAALLAEAEKLVGKIEIINDAALNELESDLSTAAGFGPRSNSSAAKLYLRACGAIRTLRVGLAKLSAPTAEKE